MRLVFHSARFQHQHDRQRQDGRGDFSLRRVRLSHRPVAWPSRIYLQIPAEKTAEKSSSLFRWESQQHTEIELKWDIFILKKNSLPLPLPPSSPFPLRIAAGHLLRKKINVKHNYPHGKVILHGTLADQLQMADGVFFKRQRGLMNN